uniref:C2H2-type domain-containing protein n=1 Tax=Angiostrongylus cantonensis TaxID=6313 RepID=A0A0K0D7W3_ANGCA
MSPSKKKKAFNAVVNPPFLVSNDDERFYVNAELPEGQINASRTMLSALLQPTWKSELLSYVDNSMEHVRPQEVQTANVVRTPILVANKQARLQSRNVFSAPLNKEHTQSNTRRRRIACQKAGCRRSVFIENVGRHVRTHVQNAPYSVNTDRMLQLCFPNLACPRE